MNRTTLAFFDLIFILAACTLFYIVFIHSYILLTPDEGRYAGIAQEMLRHHQWITPKQDGNTFLDKPILVYWLEIFSMKAFGITEFAARFVPMCFGILGVGLIYIAGRALFNRRTAIVASFILMTSPLYFFEAHYTNMDEGIAVLLSGALWFAIMGLELKPGLARKAYFWVAYVFAALAILTKGLMGIVFPIMIIGMWTLILHEWRQLKHMSLFSGLIIILLLVSPWYFMAEYQTHAFFRYFFVVQQFDRFSGNHFNMHNPIYYYPLIVLAGMLPWSVFIPQTLLDQCKRLRHLRTASKEWYLILWTVLILVFFSIPASKISSYILPIFPPLAMLIARYFDLHWQQLFARRSTRISLWALAILITACIVAIFFLPQHLIHSGKAPTVFIVSFALSLVLTLFLGAKLRWLRTSFTRYCSFMIIASMAIFTLTYSSLHYYVPSTDKQAAQFIKSHLNKNGIVVSYMNYDGDLPFYMQKNMYVVTYGWHDPAILRGDNWQGELAKGAKMQRNFSLLLNEQELQKKWQSSQQVIVFVYEKSLNQFYQKIDKNPTILAQFGPYYVLTQNRPATDAGNPATSASHQLPQPESPKSSAPESSRQSPPRNQS